MGWSEWRSSLSGACLRIWDWIGSAWTFSLGAVFALIAVAGLSADTAAVADLDPVVTSLSQAFVMEPIDFATGTTAAEQLYAYINAARAQFALPPLAYGYELSAAAQGHAEAMNNLG